MAPIVNFKLSRKIIYCRTCGKEFQAVITSNQEYCCHSCAAKTEVKDYHQRSYLRYYVASKCKYCGKEFFSRKKLMRKFCSRQCSILEQKRNPNNRGRHPWNYHVTGYKLPTVSSSVKKLWKDNDYVERNTRNRIEGEHKSYNKSEQKLDKILQLNFPSEWQYNSGQVIIERKIPDYININGKKVFIEFLGCYHHGCKICYPDSTKIDNFELREKIFQKYGYKTLSIWGHELENEISLVTKIRKFVSR